MRSRSDSDVRDDVKCKNKWRENAEPAVSISSACTIDTSRTRYVRDRDIHIHLYNSHLMHGETDAAASRYRTSSTNRHTQKNVNIN